MPVELVPLCTAEILIDNMVDIGVGPTGRRLIGEVASARFEGRISGDLIGHAVADWSTVSPDGKLGSADIRLTFRTDDGANVLMQYLGRNHMAGFPGPVTAYVAPLFETGDERYQWLNYILAVGKGLLTDMVNLKYEFYEVV